MACTIYFLFVVQDPAGKMFPLILTFIVSLTATNVGCTNYQPRAIQLSDENWSDILEGEWMIEFMAPWCPACNSFKETWDNFANKWSRDLDIQVGVIDVTENPGLSGRFLVTALPSIYHVKNGIFRQYLGGRQENELITFIDDKKWEDVEPVSKWVSPDSIQMSMVGLFFKLAMKIRAFYTLMTEEYGIPEWGCYVIFAVLTIIVGLLLGLLLVCICDFMWPPKQIPPPIPQELMDPARDQEGDIIDDTPADGDVTVRRRKVQPEDQTTDNNTAEGESNASGPNTPETDDAKESKKDN